MGFGPGRRSRARYSLTAWAVVTQFRPSFTPHMSPRLTRSRRWLADSPLIFAASRRVINSLKFGWSGLLSLAVCVMVMGSQGRVFPGMNCTQANDSWQVRVVSEIVRIGRLTRLSCVSAALKKGRKMDPSRFLRIQWARLTTITWPRFYHAMKRAI